MGGRRRQVGPRASLHSESGNGLTSFTSLMTWLSGRGPSVLEDAQHRQGGRWESVWKTVNVKNDAYSLDCL